MEPRRKRPLEARFFEKVLKTDTCWLWCGCRDPSGYGRFSVAGQNLLATRVSYELFFGKSPGDKFICHTCDNPGCVNPSHFFLGRQKENAADMVAKGRSTKHEKNPNARLNGETVQEIRRLYATGNYKQIEIARMFSVHPSLISYIVRNKIWT